VQSRQQLSVEKNKYRPICIYRMRIYVVYVHTVACRPVARQRQRKKQLYDSRY
jgi:hypothetical protein